MRNKFTYATVDVKGFLKDFHEKAKEWDDNYVMLVFLAVNIERKCRRGDDNFSRIIEDMKPRSAVVGSCAATWCNEVQ